MMIQLSFFDFDGKIEEKAIDDDDSPRVVPDPRSFISVYSLQQDLPSVRILYSSHETINLAFDKQFLENLC
jgi:hypothetical protein